LHRGIISRRCLEKSALGLGILSERFPCAVGIPGGRVLLQPAVLSHGLLQSSGAAALSGKASSDCHQQMSSEDPGGSSGRRSAGSILGADGTRGTHVSRLVRKRILSHVGKRLLWCGSFVVHCREKPLQLVLKLVLAKPTEYRTVRKGIPLGTAVWEESPEWLSPTFRRLGACAKEELPIKSRNRDGRQGRIAVLSSSAAGETVNSGSRRMDFCRSRCCWLWDSWLKLGSV
jgi:hypothetical protein